MWWAYTRGGGLYSGGLIVGGLRYVNGKLLTENLGKLDRL